MKRPIITVPHNTLRMVCEPVDFTKHAEQLKKYITDLSDTLVKKEDPKGVGLAAPQIDKPIRIFATYLQESLNAEQTGRADEETEKEKPVLAVYINPEILETSEELTFGPDPEDPLLEGCLSIPKLYGPVPRFEWVRLRYFTPEQKQKEGKFYGFFGRVIQHEFDHLNGVLFTDYTLKHNLPLYEIRGKKMVEIEPSIAQTF